MLKYVRRSIELVLCLTIVWLGIQAIQHRGDHSRLDLLYLPHRALVSLVHSFLYGADYSFDEPTIYAVKLPQDKPYTVELPKDGRWSVALRADNNVGDIVFCFVDDGITDIEKQYLLQQNSAWKTLPDPPRQKVRGVRYRRKNATASDSIDVELVRC